MNAHARVHVAVCSCASVDPMRCCVVVRRSTLGAWLKPVQSRAPDIMEVEVPPPPPASPWVANSKQHWLYLTKTYKERLKLYWKNLHGEEREEDLKKQLAEERAKCKRAQATIANYQQVHKRLVDLVVKELVLPPPPKKAPICIRDEDVATGESQPKKKARLTELAAM